MSLRMLRYPKQLRRERSRCWWWELLRGAEFTAAALFLIAGLGLMQAKIGGIVSDTSGLPLANARVSIHGAWGDESNIVFTTNSAGAFDAELVRDGSYFVDITMPGFVGVRYGPVESRFPDTITLKVRLLLQGIGEGGVQDLARIHGELYARAVPVTGASVCLQQGKKAPVCTTTNLLGQYSIEVKPGVYSVTITDRKRTVLFKNELTFGSGDHGDELTPLSN